MLLSAFIDHYNRSPKGAMTALRYNHALQNHLMDYAAQLTGMGDLTLNEAAHLAINPHEKPTCEWCGDKKRKFTNVAGGYAATCGTRSCIAVWRSHLNSESSKKINWERSNQKREATCQDKYGGVSNLSGGTQSRQRAADRLLEVHGVTHPLKSKAILDKRIKTTLERHGTLNFIAGEKARETLLKNWGVTNPMNLERFRNQVAEVQSAGKLVKLQERCNEWDIRIIDGEGVAKYYLDLHCDRCDTRHTGVLRQTVNFLLRSGCSPCHVCHPVNRYRSSGENEVAEFIKSVYAGEVHTNRKYLGTEVDIIIPDLKLGIEYNGVYWHGELRKEPGYHKQKKILIQDMGYELIHIWEDDWANPAKRAIIESKLLHKLGLTPHRVGARQCEVVQVSQAEATAFMQENHLHGSVNAKHRIGLRYMGELVMLCTWGAPRKAISGGHSAEYELLRMATKKRWSVSGGFAKILSAFRQGHSGEILTYADCDWTNTASNGYLSTGFRYVKWTSPGYHWVVRGIRHNRMSFMRSKIRDIQPSETVEEYMHTRGYWRIWNSGNLLFVL